MDKDRRIQELLEANNRLVEINRKLKYQLRSDQFQFNFYAENHRKKNTKDGDNKALTNDKFVSRIDAVLEECSPR